MAPRLAGNAKVGTGSLPFRSMRRNPASSGAALREQMGKLMT